MKRTLIFFALLIPGPLAGPAPAGDKDGDALAAVKKHLESLKAEGALVKEINGDVSKVFPDLRFVAVRFPLYPVARVPAEPLKSQNIMVVEKDKVKLVTEPKGLEPYFKNLNTKAADLIPAGRAYALLVQEFYQDGYFKFELKKDAFSLNVVDGTLLGIQGKVSVVPEIGNKGQITFTFTVDGKVKIISIAQESKVVAGVRPRCQATYLLHPDPVLRAICEQDLLVMGRAAEGYLREQRAKAAPDLRREIDRVWERIVKESR